MASSTSSAPIRIVGGTVVDPAHGPPRVRDLLLMDGKVAPPGSPGSVASAAERARVIDARGKLVMPGAIDMHSHIASRGVALARRVQDETGTPAVVPSLAETGEAYLRLGYTTVIDAAVPPGEANFTHQNLDHIPGLDTGFLMEVGLDHGFIQQLEAHGQDAATAYLGEQLRASGAYGLKLVNPGHTDDLDAPLRNSTLTPRDVILAALEAVEQLGLPHPLHLHGPRMGTVGGIEATLELLRVIGDRRAHLAHAQFHSYAIGRHGELVSGAAPLLAALRDHPRITCDTGCISFGPAMMVTRDRPLAQRLTGEEGVHHDAGWYAMPLYYDDHDPVNAVQWAIGLELILRCEDLSRMALSVDHPNGGSFTHLLDILSLLRNARQRDAMLERIDPAAREHTSLGALSQRELSEDELVTLTRLAPAKAFGLSDKGHLGVGADADVSIASAVDTPPEMVIKSAKVVVEDGQCFASDAGRRLMSEV